MAVNGGGKGSDVTKTVRASPATCADSLRRAPGRSPTCVARGRRRFATKALQMPIDLLQADASADHDHLGAVEQLGDLQRQGVVTLVFGGQPHLAGLLQQLLALSMHAR